MANYGRGGDDGYGSQSPEAIDAYQERQEIEAGQMQNARARRERENYGRTKISKLRAAVNNLRTAIRAEGTPAIQDAWDRVEPWVDRIFREDG